MFANIMEIRIDLDARAIVFRDGLPVRALEPGLHRIRRRDEHVTTYDTTEPMLDAPAAVRAVMPEGWYTEIELDRRSLGVVVRDGRPERLDVRRAAATLDLPTLLLQGARDRNVPEQEAHDLRTAYPEGRARIHVVEGAGHNFGARHPLTAVPPQLEEALAVTVDHFEQYLLPARRES